MKYNPRALTLCDHGVLSARPEALTDVSPHISLDFWQTKKEFMIRVKRAYAPVERSDGRRFLVDHLWPRGVKKESLGVEAWIKALSPSNGLRRWFGHDPAKWAEFQRRYFAELENAPESWQPLLEAAQAGDITLVFSAKDVEHNNAVALKSYLERKLAAGRRKTPQLAGARAA